MINHRLNETLTVYRSGYVSDGSGGRTRTTTEHGTIRAQVSQPSAQERLTASQLGANLTAIVHTTRNAEVERGDFLDNDGGRRLRVTSVVTNSRDTYLRLECEEVQGE